MNNAWSQSTQTTPIMLNYGQHPDTPVTLQLRAHNPAVIKFVGKRSAQLTRAKRCIQAAQQRQKTQADRRRSPAPEFAPGHEVWIQIKFFKLHEGIRPKLAPRYLGPVIMYRKYTKLTRVRFLVRERRADLNGNKTFSPVCRGTWPWAYVCQRTS
jgi:hypothetical protein